MQRIAIIGSSGSGKSTLALELHKLLQLPVYHLDQYNWLPGWHQRPHQEFAREHSNLCKQQQWIIEGIYTRTFEERIKSADTVIYLDFSRVICIWRILKRLWKYTNKPTPTSAPGCFERFDICFWLYVWNFNRYYKAIITSLLNQHQKKEIYIFKTQNQVQVFLNSLKNNES